MIGIIGTPHWNDLLAVGSLVVIVFALCHLAKRLIDLAIDAMRRPPALPTVYAGFDHDPASDFARHADDAQRLTHAGRDIAPEDEPSWPGKVDLLIEPVDDNPARYATGGPINQPGPLLPGERGCDFVVPTHGELPPEKPAETSQPRHSADDTETELFPVVVDDETATQDTSADESVGAS